MTRRLPHQDAPSQLPIWDLVARLQPTYRPRPYAGEVTLFLPANVPFEQFNELRSSWTKVIAPANFKVVTVPGDHYTIVEEPHVRVLASHVAARLKFASSRPHRAQKQRERIDAPVAGTTFV